MGDETYSLSPPEVSLDTGVPTCCLPGLRMRAEHISDLVLSLCVLLGASSVPDQENRAIAQDIFLYIWRSDAARGDSARRSMQWAQADWCSWTQFQITRGHTLPPLARPTRRIEFIGDSDTTAYQVCANLASCAASHCVICAQGPC